AARCAGVDVIAAGAPAGVETPPNVRVVSLGKERGAGRAAQAAALAGALTRIVPGAGAVLVHMLPSYPLVAFAFPRPAGRPLALWSAQGGVARSLRLASRLVDRLLTPTRDSFPLAGPAVARRLVVTGHGIDTTRYAPNGTVPVRPPRLLAAGRLSPSKR